LLEAGLGDVRAPRLALARVVLEREDAAAEVPHARGEPDRRVAARAADFEHLAVGLRRGQRVEELPGRRRDLACPELARDVLLALAAVVLLEAREHGTDTVVEHQRRSRSTASRTKHVARWSFTIPHACIVE